MATLALAYTTEVMKRSAALGSGAAGGGWQMLAEDPGTIENWVALDDPDADALQHFCEALGAHARGGTELDPGVASAGLQAAGRVAGALTGGGGGVAFSPWKGRLIQTPEAGKKLLQLAGQGHQMTLTLDSMARCAGGIWIHEGEDPGPGAAMFTVAGGALLVDRPALSTVRLEVSPSGWIGSPAFEEHPVAGSDNLWGLGAAIAGVGAEQALAGAARAAARYREAKAAAAAAQAAAEKAAAEKAAAEKAAAEKAAAEQAAAERAAADKAAAERAGAGKQWFYTRDGQSLGPVPEPELRQMAASLPAGTLVWNPELPGWKPLNEAGLAPVPEKKWELAVTSGPAAGKYFSVTAGMKLGRATECDVCLLDPMASRVHATIARQEDGFWISDNNSSNGTTVNGSMVTQPVRLSAGDVIHAGDSELVFQEAAHTPSPAGSPVLSTVVVPPPEPAVPEPFLNQPVAPEPYTPEQYIPQPVAHQHVCPRCGFACKADDRFCENCGQRLS